MAGAALALTADRLIRSKPLLFARMTGTTIADPTAVGWMTDFLNSAYFAKARDQRELDDFRLAFAILTTRWHHLGPRRLNALDVLAFHRTFFRERWQTAQSSRGTLTQEQLLAGAAALLGDWFPEAWQDHERRGWGIVFATREEKATHDPEQRLAHARLGPLTPPTSWKTDDPGVPGQVWHTYPPVEVVSLDGALSALLDVAAWPDYASELGRFTPLRNTGLADQTFEIEVLGFPTSRTPILVRAYVTIEQLVTQDQPDALREYVEHANKGFAVMGRGEDQPVPEDAETVAAFDLVCHEGHFMGQAKNRLFVFTQDGRTYLRAGGTWDAMDWHLAQLYSRAGRYAQHAFWGMESPDESMLHQIGRVVERQQT